MKWTHSYAVQAIHWKTYLVYLPFVSPPVCVCTPCSNVCSLHHLSVDPVTTHHPCCVLSPVSIPWYPAKQETRLCAPSMCFLLPQAQPGRNYDIGNRELLAIKLALEEWRHWLDGAQQDRFLWPNMARDVRRFVQGCPSPRVLATYHPANSFRRPFSTSLGYT